jgi:serine/threonine protein kinase
MKKQAQNKKEIILLDQGSNGCIFHPEIKCRHSTVKRGSKDQQYVSKIQLQSDVKNEEMIGQRLKTIPNFRFYFAPILESCPVNLSSIDERQMEKCNVVAKHLTKTPKPTFVSSTIPYLGKTTLGDYLFESTQQPREYITKVLDTHLYLLDALIKLGEANIVHFDLKGNNIMQDTKNDVPILIDFGISIQDIETLDIQDYESHFPVVVEEYFPWCIDIILLCYIATTLRNRAKDLSRTYAEKINEKDTAQMKRHASVYVFKNPILQITSISQEERVQVETQLHKWIDSQKSKTWRQFAKELISYHKSWDNYALSAIYLLELDDMRGPTSPSIPSFMDEYLDLLKTNILQTPQTRWTPSYVASQLKSKFKRVKKDTLVDFIKGQLSKIKTPGYLTSIKEEKQKRVFREIESRENIQKQIRKRKAV